MHYILIDNRFDPRNFSAEGNRRYTGVLFIGELGRRGKGHYTEDTYTYMLLCAFDDIDHAVYTAYGVYHAGLSE